MTSDIIMHPPLSQYAVEVWCHFRRSHTVISIAIPLTIGPWFKQNSFAALPHGATCTLQAGRCGSYSGACGTRHGLAPPQPGHGTLNCYQVHDAALQGTDNFHYITMVTVTFFQVNFTVHLICLKILVIQYANH